MTDEEIKAYVDRQIAAMKSGMIDISNLPKTEIVNGMSLPFVKDKILSSADVSNLGGGGKGLTWYEGD